MCVKFLDLYIIYTHTVYILVYRYIIYMYNIFIRSPKNLPQKILTYFRWDNFLSPPRQLLRFKPNTNTSKEVAKTSLLSNKAQGADEPLGQLEKKPGPKGCKVESFWWFFGETHCSKVFFWGGGRKIGWGLKNIGNAQSSKSFGGWRLLTVELKIHRGSLIHQTTCDWNYWSIQLNLCMALSQG